MDELEKHESAFSRLLGQASFDDQARQEHRDALRAQALAAFDAASQPAPVAWKRILNQGKEIMRRPVPRFVAAAAACLAIVAAWSLFPASQSTAHAFNMFAEAIVGARSATFEMDVKIEGTPGQKVQSYYLAPGRVRNEVKVGETEAVSIVDPKTGKVLMLMPAQKMATIMNMQNIERDPKKPDMNDMFEQMRDLLAKSKGAKEGEFKPLGEKEIDGHRTLGFRHESPTQTLTLWGDPVTGMPVLIEMKLSGLMEFAITMSHFKLNDDLQPELFDTTPPEGYTVQTYNINASKPTEATLIDMLSKFSDLNEGVFPDTLATETIMPLFMKQFPRDPTGKAWTVPPKLVEMAALFGRAMAWAWELPTSAEAHYAGKEVKRGEPDRPIFWYKPEGGKKYRVIYADLTVKEADGAPEVEGAVGLTKSKGPGFLAALKGSHSAGDPNAVSKMMTKLKYLALAMHNDSELYNRFPSAAIRSKDGKPLLSWRVKLLRYLDQEELYKQFHLDEPWDSEHNRPLVEKMPDCYQTPQTGDLTGKTVFLVPTGKETIFAGDKGTKANEITDGPAETILVVEADAQHAVPWTKPEDLEIDSKNPAAGIQREGGVFVLARADGSVVTVPADINAATLWSFFTRAGGEKIDWPK